MDKASSLLLRDLLLHRPVAALATLHEGWPFASMVPFAASVSGGRLRLVTHVSRLATHTRDMLSVPQVCLLITAPESTAVPPQALPRVSIPAIATFIPAEHADHDLLKVAYLAKHPQATELFQFGDFSIVAIEPVSARFVAGFARALTLTLEALAAVVEPAGLA